MPQSPDRKKQYAKERRAKHGDRIRAKQAEWASRNRDHLLARGRKRRMEKRAMCLVAHARIRARRLGVAFDLDKHIDDIQHRINAGACELTGLPFDLSGGKRQYASPSLDRRVPALGYIAGNVRVICYGMNAALGNWGETALLEMLEAWTVTRLSRKSRPSSSAQARSDTPV